MIHNVFLPICPHELCVLSYLLQLTLHGSYYMLMPLFLQQGMLLPTSMMGPFEEGENQDWLNFGRNNAVNCKTSLCFVYLLFIFIYSFTCDLHLQLFT